MLHSIRTSIFLSDLLITIRENMAKKGNSSETLDLKQAKELLERYWQAIVAEASAKPDIEYIDDSTLHQAICSSVNHRQVTYRFCLPIQVLGKLTNPTLDCLRLQKKKGDPDDVSGWDARSLGSKVVAPFNQGKKTFSAPSNDPYVGNPMRIPRMVYNDPSKKDVKGWNTLIDVLEQVESRNNPDFTELVFLQVLLEIFRRQKSLRFTYPLPLRISLENTFSLAHRFLEQKSGGDRGLALCGALFDAIGMHFGLYSKVERARINASDEAIGQAADLECVNDKGEVVLVIEVKERTLTLTDIEGTLRKCRKRKIKNIFFAAPVVKKDEKSTIDERITRAFASGQNLYVFDFFDLARSVLSLGGEQIRITFLQKVGEHLDLWNTQPSHRQAWKNLLEEV
ncbi:MAG: restriction endonuclease, SacI family [Deltaproteobacteria bacterium]|nr:restriction endonuclease, SacI family [Deltaproteobacteria bacterium]